MHTFPHRILTKPLREKYHYACHFTDEKTGAWWWGKNSSPDHLRLQLCLSHLYNQSCLLLGEGGPLEQPGQGSAGELRELRVPLHAHHVEDTWFLRMTLRSPISVSSRSPKAGFPVPLESDLHALPGQTFDFKAKAEHGLNPPSTLSSRHAAGPPPTCPVVRERL